VTNLGGHQRGTRDLPVLEEAGRFVNRVSIAAQTPPAAYASSSSPSALRLAPRPPPAATEDSDEDNDDEAQEVDEADAEAEEEAAAEQPAQAPRGRKSRPAARFSPNNAVNVETDSLMAGVSVNKFGYLQHETVNQGQLFFCEQFIFLLLRKVLSTSVCVNVRGDGRAVIVQLLLESFPVSKVRGLSSFVPNEEVFGATREYEIKLPDGLRVTPNGATEIPQGPPEVLDTGRFWPAFILLRFGRIQSTSKGFNALTTATS